MTEVARAPRFKGVCDYVGINGTTCGKRCVQEHRCSQHNGKESYSSKCKHPDCNRMTRSTYGMCSHHVSYAKKDPAATRSALPDDVTNLTKQLKELGYVTSVRPKKVQVKDTAVKEQPSTPPQTDQTPQAVPQSKRKSDRSRVQKEDQAESQTVLPQSD